jgi:hypothetical protein
MSQLRLFQPRYLDSSHSETDPVILSFPQVETTSTTSIFSNAVRRAEVIYNNRFCPSCNHPEVEPLELDDGINNRNGIPIPGTCTLVGFHCLDCHSEWPV